MLTCQSLGFIENSRSRYTHFWYCTLWFVLPTKPTLCPPFLAQVWLLLLSVFQRQQEMQCGLLVWQASNFLISILMRQVQAIPYLKSCEFSCKAYVNFVHIDARRYFELDFKVLQWRFCNDISKNCISDIKIVDILTVIARAYSGKRAWFLISDWSICLCQNTLVWTLQALKSCLILQGETFTFSGVYFRGFDASKLSARCQFREAGNYWGCSSEATGNDTLLQEIPQFPWG